MIPRCVLPILASEWRALAVRDEKPTIDCQLSEIEIKYQRAMIRYVVYEVVTPGA